jgi:hypothetical protein
MGDTVCTSNGNINDYFHDIFNPLNPGLPWACVPPPWAPSRIVQMKTIDCLSECMSVWVNLHIESGLILTKIR